MALSLHKSCVRQSLSEVQAWGSWYQLRCMGRCLLCKGQRSSCCPRLNFFVSGVSGDKAHKAQVLFEKVWKMRSIAMPFERDSSVKISKKRANPFKRKAGLQSELPDVLHQLNRKIERGASISKVITEQ